MNDIRKKQWGRLRHLRVGIVFSALLSACAPQTTLFQSDFDQTPIGQPPAHMQRVGTANVDGPPGSVVVVASPVQTGGRWVQILRPNDHGTIVAFQGVFAQFAGDGSYTFDATLFIPTGKAVPSVQFEQFDQPVANSFKGFLHLDFLQNGKIRIDDRPETTFTFGAFPHDQPFIVQVILNINPMPTAHIVLGGAGTSGQMDYAIQQFPPPFPDARRFGAVRLWMGIPQSGPFDATNIVVTKAQ